MTSEKLAFFLRTIWFLKRIFYSWPFYDIVVLVYYCCCDALPQGRCLNLCKFIISQLCRSEVWFRPTRLRSKCCQCCIPFWRLYGESVPLLFPVFWGQSHTMSLGPFPPSSKLAMMNWCYVLLTSHLSSLFLFYGFLLIILDTPS